MALTTTDEPLVGDTVTVSQTLTVGGTEVELALSELTIVSVPNGSEVETGLVVDSGGNPVLYFEPDVPGPYAISVTGYEEIANPPEFGLEPVGVTEKTVAIVETATVSVGALMDLPILTTNGHRLDLRLTVHDNVISDVTIANGTTPQANAALYDATVVTKIGNLVGESVASAGPALATAVGTLGAKFDLHLTQATIHPVSDTVNTYDEDPPIDITEAVSKLNKIRSELVQHLLNASTSGVRWHTADDTENVPISPDASSLASATQLYADLAWRCYNRHRTETASPAAHNNADNTNTLGSIDKLSDVIVAILDFLADNSPTIPSDEPEGIILAESLYGFTLTEGT